MAAALIGVFGAILGALVTALLNRQLEANSRRREARAVAQLISGEIKTAAIRLGSYAKARKYGTDPISFDMWQAKGATLTAELQGTALSNAFALIESWERTRARHAGEPVSEEDAAALEEDRKTLDSFAKSLEDAVPRPFLERAPGLVWGLGIFAGLAVLAACVVLAIACLAPRAEMTDHSIATALANEIQGETYVSCSHGADRWHCEVGYPRPSCKVAASSRTTATLFVASPEPSHKPKPCDAGQAASANYDIGESPEGPLATLDPEKIARDEFRRAIRLQVADPSYLDQAVDDVLGDD